MKKLITLILAVGFALLLVSCNANTLNTTPDENGVIQTPVRIGREGTMQASLHWPYEALEEIVDKACVIADVTITSWLGESDGPEVTFFSAEVNSALKGEPAREIIIYQSGNSDWTFDGYPLFKVGNRMILLLRNLRYHYPEELPEWTPYDDVYGIFGQQIAILHIDEVDDTFFLTNRFYRFGNSIANASQDYGIASVSADISNEVINQRNTIDPFLKSSNGREEHVFFYDEIAQLIGEVANR